jgi:hypothetical protein
MAANLARIDTGAAQLVFDTCHKCAKSVFDRCRGGIEGGQSVSGCFSAFGVARALAGSRPGITGQPFGAIEPGSFGFIDLHGVRGQGQLAGTGRRNRRSNRNSEKKRFQIQTPRNFRNQNRPQLGTGAAELSMSAVWRTIRLSSVLHI